MCIFTKCIDNFKFSISLKSYAEYAFSITSFLYGWQKIFTNKNIFSNNDLHVLFILFFSEVDNKNNYLSCYDPLKQHNITSVVIWCLKGVTTYWYCKLPEHSLTNWQVK